MPVCVLGLLLVTDITAARANESFPIDRPEFELVWERTEAPVARGDAQRSWLWGPEPRTPGLTERYLDSPGQERVVQYFDKGRMEVNNPDADPSDPWFVTSGLLTRELISGQIQIGDEAFLDTGSGASIQIAGDHLTPFPQYRHMAEVVDQGNQDRTGEQADKVLTPDGLDPSITPPDDANADFVHHVVYHGPESVDVGYNIPAAFWDYLNAPGTVYDSAGNPVVADPLFSWIFVMGFPIADAFWAEVPVGGVVQWVLIQPFERRVLTYTPSNSPEWQVEMGNIGQHYRDWRAQYFQSAVTGGDPDFFGLHNDATWRYGTNLSVDEVWESAGTTTSFTPGSTLYARDEHKLDGLRTTYWAPGSDGLYLHGWDLLNNQRDLLDMVVYSPPLRVMPAEWSSEARIAPTTAISMHSEPEQTDISFDPVSQQLVSTPAGLFQTWRIESNDFEDPGLRHALGEVFWFEGQIGIIQWIDHYSAYLMDSSVLQD
jgi:hypothetical protein